MQHALQPGGRFLRPMACPACSQGRLTRSASTPRALVCVQCGGAVDRPSSTRGATRGHLLLGGLMGLSLVLGLGLTLVDASETGRSSGSHGVAATTKHSPAATP